MEKEDSMRMKRTALMLTLTIVILFSMVVGVQFAKVAMSNPDSFIKEYFGIIIESPLNETYRTNKIILNVTTYIPLDGLTPLTYLRYSVDNGAFIDYVGAHEENNATIKGALLNLPDGSHIIRVEARTVNAAYGVDMEVCGNVTFTIDTHPPSISVLMMKNATYYTADVPLNFTVSEPVSQLSYSLDAKANVTITGNTTLTGLPDGEHNLTVYASDSAGNIGVSETIYFSVKVPFPTTLVVASVVLVAAIGTALLFYFKKRKR